jgi:hypothetical protein
VVTAAAAAEVVAMTAHRPTPVAVSVAVVQSQHARLHQGQAVPATIVTPMMTGLVIIRRQQQREIKISE